MITNPRDAYDRWLRRKPISTLALLGFALLLGLQVFAWSRGAGAATALARGLVVALAAGVVGMLFMRVASVIKFADAPEWPPPVKEIEYQAAGDSDLVVLHPSKAVTIRALGIVGIRNARRLDVPGRRPYASRAISEARASGDG